MRGLKYLQHDVDASCDPKTLALLDSDGAAGYGRYWLLLELLGRSSDGFLDVNDPATLAIIGAQVRIRNRDKVRAFLQTLADLGLIDRDRYMDARVVGSNSLLKRWEDADAKVERAKAAANKRWHKDGNADA